MIAIETTIHISNEVDVSNHMAFHEEKKKTFPIVSY